MGRIMNSASNSLLRFSKIKHMKIIMQAEGSECGMACIAMIANFHGKKISIDKLRQLSPPSSQGASLSQLLKQAELLDLSCRALKVQLSELKELRTPCILHWNFKHFVVLINVNSKQCELADPALGMRKIKIKELSDSFTGVALEILPSPKFERRKDDNKLNLSDFLVGIIGLKRHLSILFGLSFLIQIFAIAAPFYMQTVIDEVIVKADTSLLTLLALAFTLLLCIDTITTLLRERVMLYFSNQFGMHMATRVFKHLLSLPSDYFQRRQLGDIVSRFGSLQNIRETVSSGLISGLIDGLMAMLMLIVLFIYSSHLAMLVCLIVFLYGMLRYVFFRETKRQSAEVIQHQAQESTHFMQSVRAIKTIKLNNSATKRMGDWLNLLSSSMNKQIRLSRWQINFSVINKAMFGLENIFIVYLAAQLVTQNLFSIGMLYAFMSYKGKFINATDSLISKWLEFKLLRVHLDRLADIVFTEGEFTKDINTEVNNRVESLSPRVDSCYHLSTRSLGFRYHHSEATIFSDLDLNIPRGKTVVITGQSGCGKSSLLLCLMGLNAAYEGKIYINGNQLGPHNRHQQDFAAVLQDDQLLSGSVLDNITDFCATTNLSLVIDVANACCLHQDIMQMTMQYNTLIGDMGSTLSGGQKQRLLLARALYKKPKLLFLDEATSHLDAIMEMNINNNIAKLNMTKIVIAHRQETIASADIVLALNQGVLSDISQTITRNSLQQQASI